MLNIHLSLRQIRETVIVVSIVIFSILLFPHFLYAAEPHASIPAIRKLQEKGSIVIGIPPYNTPPFYYREPATSELLGYDIEICQALAQKLGVKAIFDESSSSFNDLVARAGRGDVDVAIGKLGTTYTRLFNAHPHVYMKFQQALLLNRKTLVGIGNEKDPELGRKIKKSNIRIAAIHDSAYDVRAALEFPNATIVPTATWDDAVQFLRSGKVEAIYRDSLEIAMLTRRDPKLTLQFASVIIADLDDVKSIFLGEANSGLGPLIDFLIADQYPTVDEQKIMNIYPQFFRGIG